MKKYSPVRINPKSFKQSESDRIHTIFQFSYIQRDEDQQTENADGWRNQRTVGGRAQEDSGACSSRLCQSAMHRLRPGTNTIEVFCLLIAFLTLINLRSSFYSIDWWSSSNGGHVPPGEVSGPRRQTGAALPQGRCDRLRGRQYRRRRRTGDPGHTARGGVGSLRDAPGFGPGGNMRRAQTA